MNFKRNGFLLVSVLVLSFLLIGTGFAAEEEMIDPDIPESWYEAPKTSSEMNIKEFNQSSMLSKKVESGEIPSLQERIPNDPPVIEPYKEIGEYGGTITVWDYRLSPSYEVYNLNNRNLSGAISTPDGEIVPHYFKEWDYSSNYKEITIHLREGVKWSDGEPFTADDYIFWWEHVAQNEELTPTPPEKWDPGILEVKKNGKWEITITFDRPAPIFYTDFRYSLFNAQPAHFMKKFHPDFVGEKEAQKIAEEAELENWYDYYARVSDDSPWHPEYKHVRPVLTPYIPVKRTETTLILERNPYYPFVDTEGNQLPYIDRIRVNGVNEQEMVGAKAVTGEATIASKELISRNIPLYKRNEEKENYETLLFKKTFGSEAGIYANLTHKDPKLRSIYQDSKFRQALSLSIDREEINNKVYYGEAEPRQATLGPQSYFFEEKFADAYAEYNPEKARKLLDEIGMIDRDNDGWRELPEGTKKTMSGEEVELIGGNFAPQLMYSRTGAAEPTKIMELVRKYFREIGIEVSIKKVSRELYLTRWAANEGDMGSWLVGQMIGPLSQQPYAMRSFAPISHPGFGPFPGWVNWHTTDGEEGMEPPTIMKDLIKNAEIMGSDINKENRIEAGKQILEAQAENIWAIGTVGFGPFPIIKKNYLKNVPKKGLWGFTVSYLGAYRPAQFYIEE